jgi:hypothetical protein
MQRFRFGHETFGIASGETLELKVSEPGEFTTLADFASLTILGCSLVGALIVREAPPRTLSALDRAAWVAGYIHKYAGVDLPPLTQCQMFVEVEEANRLLLAIEAQHVYVAFCWDVDQDWRQGGYAKWAAKYPDLDRQCRANSREESQSVPKNM